MLEIVDTPRESLTVLGIDPGSRYLGYAIIRAYPDVAAGIQSETLLSGVLSAHPKQCELERYMNLARQLDSIVYPYQDVIQKVALEDNRNIVFGLAKRRIQSMAIQRALGLALGVIAGWEGLDASLVTLTPDQVRQAFRLPPKCAKDDLHHHMRTIQLIHPKISPDEADATAIAYAAAKMELGQMESTDLEQLMLDYLEETPSPREAVISSLGKEWGKGKMQKVFTELRKTNRIRREIDGTYTTNAA